MIGRNRNARANDEMKWLGDIEPLLAAADRFDAVAQNPNAFKPEVPAGAIKEDPSHSKSHDERKEELIEICQTIFGLSTRESLAIGAIAIEGIDQNKTPDKGWPALGRASSVYDNEKPAEAMRSTDAFCVFVGFEVDTFPPSASEFPLDPGSGLAGAVTRFAQVAGGDRGSTRLARAAGVRCSAPTNLSVAVAVKFATSPVSK